MIDAEGRENGFRCFVQDVTEQRANEERIRIMAMRDNLTGLVNRAIFTDRLTETIERVERGSQAGVIFIDLDSFKLVNDTYGHAAGDTVLIEAARRIAARVASRGRTASFSIMFRVTAEGAARCARVAWVHRSRPRAARIWAVLIMASC